MTGETALVGHTGFVGGNLDRQFPFTDRFNSRNIETMVGRRYSLVVCAAAPGVKWRANREPAADRAAIDRLLTVLLQVKAERLILISTVDVYPEPRAVDERTLIVPVHGSPYGRHRLLLEQELSDRHPTMIVRLPGLFGPGLRKNIIFDLLTGNALEAVNPASTFQFYDLDRLWSDITVASAAGLQLINFATEPVRVDDVARHGFGHEFSNDAAPRPVHYDMWTCHAAAWGLQSRYLIHRPEVLEGISQFVKRSSRIG